jgi:predicted metalloprotease with PDZ domain
MIDIIKTVPNLQIIKFEQNFSMIHYKIASQHPLSRLVEIEIRVPANDLKKICMQLPSWRPGRYELGNFAKNILNFRASGNSSLSFIKITKDLWEIENDGAAEIKIEYSYYAADLNAGSTYTCHDFLYVNPVNCLMFLQHEENLNSKLHISVPSGFELATGATFTKTANGFDLEYDTYHELADSPFIASRVLQSKTYTAGESEFYIWFNGECKPDWKKVITDFKKFTERQIQSFGKFTCKKYHFLIHATPFPFYHGVEHLTSSVNALGPGYAITEERYEDLLGLCSHELYHSWNIKSIRPAEMYPYRYHEENYFRTGFVAEGVTTYMGDLMLYTSEVFNDSQYLNELTQQLQKHMDNGGRTNYSVAESGFDTWLDGYVPGVPDRKVSIYTEGCLIALMCDVLILENTVGKSNLDDVMRELYNEYALKNKGYSADEYRSLIEKYAGNNLAEIFDDLVFGTKSYLPLLETCLEKLGLEIVKTNSPLISERIFGMKIAETPEKTMVTQVQKGSPAHSVLAPNDQIIAVNNMSIKGDLNRWLNYFNGQIINFTLLRSGTILQTEIIPVGNPYYDVYSISTNQNFPTELAKAWKKRM